MAGMDVLNAQLRFCLEGTDFRLGEKYEGKVRDNYTVGDERIIITTDRLSAFDVVLCMLPFKGQVLNEMSGFWFRKTGSAVPNHVLKIPHPNVTVARNCSPIPVEFVVRGYITGVTTTSIWYSYERGVRDFCGHVLQDGLRKDEKLDCPIVTPSTKAEKGHHDESISRAEVIKRGLMDADDFDMVSEMSLKLFEIGSMHAERNGIILVDTKYEFGRDSSGGVLLIDEVHTPDSSRFWYKDTYHELFGKGLEQRRIDKEFVRKWLADRGYVGHGIPPVIPDEVRVEAARRYIDAYEQVTGGRLDVRPGNVLQGIADVLVKEGYIDG